MPKGSRAEVLYPFEAEQDGEISVAQGERVRISTLDAPEGWVIAARALAPSEAGLVPAAYVKEVQEAAAVTPTRDDTGATSLVEGPLDRATSKPLGDFAAVDADLRWLADARHPDPEHQNRMLEGAMRPWATPAEAAQYTGSGWFSGEALHSFTDAEEDEIAIEAGEPLYIRCDEPCPEGWRHASRMDGSVGLVVSQPTARPPARPPARTRARARAPSSWPLCAPRPSPLAPRLTAEPTRVAAARDVRQAARHPDRGAGRLRGVGRRGLCRAAPLRGGRPAARARGRALARLVARAQCGGRAAQRGLRRRRRRRAARRGAASPARRVVAHGGRAACSTPPFGSATLTVPPPTWPAPALQGAGSAGPWLRHARGLG